MWTVLSYNTENGSNHKIINGVSAASTGGKITVSPEIEKLTEDILADAKNYDNEHERQGGIRAGKKESATGRRENKKTNKNRRKKVISAVVLSILGAVVLFVAMEAVNLLSIFNSVNYVSDSNNFDDTELLVNQSFVQANVSHSDETKNILLVGYDVDENGISRSDSMIILSLDHNHQKIKMTSLMRDMYLQIPQNGKHKLNAAYVYGGADLLLTTIYSNFGLKIDKYVCVDYTAFVELVDYIGGVEIEIEEMELEQFNKYVSGEKNQIDEAGTYVFNGQQTLSYCRIRKIGTDTARTARQREVLEKIITKCRSMSLPGLENMMKMIAPRLTTNFTQTEMLGMIAEGMDCVDYDTLNMRIPVDGTWGGTYINQIWYMKIELEQNAQYLNDFIYGGDLISESLASQLEENDTAAELIEKEQFEAAKSE